MRTLLAEPPLSPGPVIVSGPEAHHGRNVLRLRVGDELRLIDGTGAAGVGEVTAVERHAVHVHLPTMTQGTDGAMMQVTLAVAPPKGSRFDDLVRSATELGVGAIRPLVCERSEREPNLERARRVAGEALKQSRRVCLPTIGPALEFPTLAAQPGRVIVTDPQGGPCVPGAPSATTIIIGPEGGLTADELALVADHAERWFLARPILRIETAALAACAVLASVWGHHEH